LSAFLSERGVQPRSVFYPMHRQPCFAHLKAAQELSDERFPNAVRAYEQGVCLPIFPQLEDAAVDHICRAIAEWKPA
jgi:perosamine synthetase